MALPKAGMPQKSLVMRDGQMDLDDSRGWPRSGGKGSMWNRGSE